MSTFKGIVSEFPDIRIDFFRTSQDPEARPALASFLSHIHSDHLQGLDGFYGGPFIHCSAASKELLIKLERREHRWNFAKGIVECHNCQYAEKRAKLKVLPLETPTTVELGNGKEIRVTSFDANHCPGAVMFLIEGDGKAILYTGDIRAEEWWIQYLSRHPVLIPYTTGIKKLDKIYLDTTFACRKRVDEEFTPKREGIRELIQKINMYPKDTFFHLNTWTFGYEDVWVALAAAFNAQIHLSEYHYHLFKSIRDVEKSTQGPCLSGFQFGNATVGGCTTRNPDVRFHSCERKLGCSGLEGKKVVWITPIITRVGDFEVLEAGYGNGDLENQDDLSLHGELLQQLLQVLSPDLSPEVKELLVLASHSRKQALPLQFDASERTQNFDLEELASRLRKAVLSAKSHATQSQPPQDHIEGYEDEFIKADNGKWLPTHITFPYSRHSSYTELRRFVELFRPRDIWPCVVDNDHWSEEKSIRALFGDLCDGAEFAHDQEMRDMLEEEERREEEWERRMEEMEMLSQARMETQDDAVARKLHIQLWNEWLRSKKDKKSGGKDEKEIKLPRLGATSATSSSAASIVSGTVMPRRIKAESYRRKTTVPRPSVRISDGTLTASSAPSSPPPASPTVIALMQKIEKYDVGKARIPKLTYQLPEGSSTASNTPASSPVPPLKTPKRMLKIEEDDGEITAIVRPANQIPEGTSTASNTPASSPIPPPKPFQPPCPARPFGPSVSHDHPVSSLSQGLKFRKRPLETPQSKKQKVSPKNPDSSDNPYSTCPTSTQNYPQDLKLFTEGVRESIYPILASLPSSPQGEFDEEEVWEAQAAALGINGKSWWDVELESTRRKWRYEEEMEL